MDCWSWQICVKFDLLCTSVTTNIAGEKKKFSNPIFNLDFLHSVCLDVCLQEENRNQIFIPDKKRLHSVYFAATWQTTTAFLLKWNLQWKFGARIWDSEENLPAFQQLPII